MGCFAMHGGRAGRRVACSALAGQPPPRASSITNIGSFSDPRGDLPSHPGQLVRALYGPFTHPGQRADPQRADCPCPRPCTNCRHHRHGAEPRVHDGATANMQEACCCTTSCSSTRPSRASAARSASRSSAPATSARHLHLPSPYGYENTSTNWNMITHLVNMNTRRRTVNVEIIFRWRPLAETEPTRPLWLDIDSICNGGDSEYTIPTGYSDTHVDWTSTVRTRASSTCRATCTTSTSSTRARARCTAPRAAAAIALIGRAAWAATASDYFGPIPPNNPPPADITGATLCRSEAYYGPPTGRARGPATSTR